MCRLVPSVIGPWSPGGDHFGDQLVRQTFADKLADATTALSDETAEGAVVLMGQKEFFVVVGIIFALVALAHAVRIYMERPVIIGDWSVPKSVSWIAFMVASGLALFAFRFAADKDS
jgi:hypothetical protein